MEAVVSILIPAIVESVFGALTEAVGLSDWLRQRLGRDPEKLAFQQALTQALTDSATHYPGRDLRYFAEILRDIGGPLLARTLQPATLLPTANELTRVWLNHLTVDSLIHYRAEFTQFATLFLDRLQFYLENQQPLQWIVQARRERSSEEAIRHLAKAAEQNTANLDAMRQEVVQLLDVLETAFKNNGTRVNTGGGSYIGGNVQIDGDFVGRGKVTIKNYFVAGLPRLVIDYSSRIQDFLLEYLGSKRKRVPFGGRQQQLAELHTWLDDPTAPPYYLMTAEAGRGKSALICRWLAQLTTRTDLDVIFVPISIRFETATQDVVFAALAARLAKFYGEDDKLDLSATANERRVICELYLRRTPPAGKQLVVILDGLDEATGWHFGAGFFSTDPPPGLRVVVTARLRVGESTPQGWAATLGWHERLTQMVTLPPLSRMGIEEALTLMGDPLAGFADQVTIVEQLYRLTEGDPLLVRLYVQEFEKQKTTVGTLNNDALQQMRPGLQGYFDQWWKGQKTQWRAQGNDPEKEEAHLRLLLDALAAALGPLTLDDLAQLHPDLGSSRLIRAQLQSVERWVIGDGKTQGYSYSHLRLGYYFWEQLSDKEQAAWDDRFCAWGATTLAALNAEQLDPKAAPVYLLRHYANHLQRSHAPAEAFYALISNRWRLAWKELDISYSGFLGDVKRAWERARLAYDANRPGRAEALVQQMRAGLCRSSVAALGSNMPPELLAQLVEAGLLTPVQSLALLKLVPDEERRAKMLAAMATHLPADFMAEVLAVAYVIGNEEWHASALVSLAPHLPEHLLGEALVIARTIRNERERANVLIALAPYLPEGLLREALTAASAIGGGYGRASALSALVPRLSEYLLGEALTIAREIGGDHERAAVLGIFTQHLPEVERTKVLEEAWWAASSMRGSSSRARAIALVGLAPYLTRDEVLGKLLPVARAIKEEEFRASALRELASNLPKHERPLVLREALAAVRAIKDERLRTDELIALAPHLPVDLLGEALATARAIKNKYYGVLALSALVPHLPRDEQTKVLGDALADVRTFKYEFARASALSTLAPHLPKSERTNALEEALAAARTIGGGSERGHVAALSTLAPFLPVKVLEEALDDACAITSESARASVLRYLAPHLPQGLLGEALDTARAIRDGYCRAAALRDLALVLPESERVKVLGEALEAARVFEYNGARSSKLQELAPYLPEGLLGETLAVACAIEHLESALAALAPHLADWASRQPQRAYPAFADSLPMLAARPRPKFLDDLATLMPFILALAGDEAPQAAEGIYHAIQEVCGWWP